VSVGTARPIAGEFPAATVVYSDISILPRPLFSYSVLFRYFDATLCLCI
jgi:hypothetical protein